MKRSYSSAEVQATLSQLSALTREPDDGGRIQQDIFWPLLNAFRENPALVTPTVWRDLKEMALSGQNRTVRWTAFHAVVEMGLDDRKRGEEVKELLIRTIRDGKEDFGPEMDFRYEAIKRLFREIGQKYEDLLPEIYETLAGIVGDSDRMVRYIAAESLCLAADRCGADPVRTLDIVSPLIHGMEYAQLKEGLRRSIEDVVIYRYEDLGAETERLREMFNAQAEAAELPPAAETRECYRHIVKVFDHLKNRKFEL